MDTCITFLHIQLRHDVTPQAIRARRLYNKTNETETKQQKQQQQPRRTTHTRSLSPGVRRRGGGGGGGGGDVMRGRGGPARQGRPGGKTKRGGGSGGGGAVRPRVGKAAAQSYRSAPPASSPSPPPVVSSKPFVATTRARVGTLIGTAAGDPVFTSHGVRISTRPSVLSWYS